MVDFVGLLGSKPEAVSYDLEKLYSALDVKSTHTEPRPSQREAMKSLTERHAERDIVLKVNTGAGKTTIGLLYLYGHMRVSKEPGVYLCPTIQLIEQVLDEAARLGIAARPYLGGETFPAQEGMRGEAVIVCTYEKLFNAKSTFLRSDVNLMPNAFVLDDAHAGVENIRKQYTLRVTGTAFEELKTILSASCSKYHKTKWMDVEMSDPLALFEVPHWIWSDNVNAILDKLHPHGSEDGFMFVWPYLQDILPLCRCVISGRHAEITPEVLPTEAKRPFALAKHRLFMSATLADDSLLTRELGVSVDAASKPIMPPSDRGIGERMILAPSLVDPALERGYVMTLCAELAKQWNVVVLTSSGELANDWVQAGATRFVDDTFALGVRALKDKGSGVKFAVFAQRYDGVDLPDEACRVLVIDGTPYGEGLVDKADSQMCFTPGGVRNRTIFRIEQGMGRPVRSHADFAVVLLVGSDLTTYVGRADVLSAMTHDTRTQLQLSFELADLVKKSSAGNTPAAIRKVVDQCLGRDNGWKDYYNNRVRGVAKKAPVIDVQRIELAWRERRAYELSAQNNHASAHALLNEAIKSSLLEQDELGVYLQRLARIVYLFDPTEGIRIQQAAREKNKALANPPFMPRKPSAASGKAVAERVCAWIKQFSNPNAAIIEAKNIEAALNLGQKAKIVEGALEKLGAALGAEASRPDEEFGEGPDALWFWGGFAFVIEAKNENEHTLHKKDSGQLLLSIKWVAEHYPQYADRIYPIVVARVDLADRKAIYPNNSKVIVEASCQALGRSLVQFYQKLVQLGPVFFTPETVQAEMINFKLLPEQFLGTYGSDIK